MNYLELALDCRGTSSDVCLIHLRKKVCFRFKDSSVLTFQSFELRSHPFLAQSISKFCRKDVLLWIRFFTGLKYACFWQKSLVLNYLIVNQRLIRSPGSVSAETIIQLF